jgi:hypothetical protein
MKLTNFSVRTGTSRGLCRALPIDQLRLQSQVSKPSDCNREVSRFDLDGVTDAAELFASNERGTGAAEGIVDGLASAAAVGDHAGHQFHRLGRRVQVADVRLIDLEHVVLTAVVDEIVRGLWQPPVQNRLVTVMIVGHPDDEMMLHPS